MKRGKIRSSVISVLLLLFGFIFFLQPLKNDTVSAEKKIVQGKVVRVKDGDTIVVAPVEGGRFFVCRLYGIDAPETPKRGRPGQPFGKEATTELKRLVLGQNVTVVLTGARTYKREVCIIYRDGMNVNLEMVKRGYAWAYRRYLRRPYASEYIKAERQAREKRLGLWKQKNPTPPWEFRRRIRFSARDRKTYNF